MVPPWRSRGGRLTWSWRMHNNPVELRRREMIMQHSGVNLAANAKVEQAIAEAVRSGREIGVQVAAYLDGRLVIDAWGGLADHTTGRKVDGDTLFNTYSVTKAVAATALHIQVDRGKIDYDAPVAEYWPEYAANGKGNTTVRDVLTH